MYTLSQVADWPNLNIKGKYIITLELRANDPDGDDYYEVGRIMKVMGQSPDRPYFYVQMGSDHEQFMINGGQMIMPTTFDNINEARELLFDLMEQQRYSSL